jgi:hypothetical protein
MADSSEARERLNGRYLEYLSFLAHADGTQALYREASDSGIALVYFEIAKLELEKRGIERAPLNNENMTRSLKHVQSGKDCCDFVMPAFIRVMYEYRDSELVAAMMFEEIKRTILNYKYWMDEPGEREFTCNYFTENHQILQHCCELLAGQLYPEESFGNGMTGDEHREHATLFIERWLDWRARFGFSEWLSNCYYEEDLLALACLAEFAQRADIAARARMLMDLALFDIALNSLDGDFASTSGRTYPMMLLDPGLTGSSTISALLWGQGSTTRALNKAAVMMAAGRYQPSTLLGEIAREKPQAMENRQRCSLDVEDGEKNGVSPASFDNIMLYWGIQEYDHRLVIDNSLKTLAPWDGIGDRIHAFKELYETRDRENAPVDPDPDFTAMTQADIYTYRTPNYMLSCAQDFRRGKRGFQQHIWEATLGGKAVVFTNHPGSLEYNDRPNYWMGNGIMPQALAYKNVVVCIYKIEPTYTRLWQSHAFFPQSEFDEVVTKGNWIFGRKRGGYVALHSMNDGKWNAPDSSLYKHVYKNDASFDYSTISQYDFSARGHANVWVCELGEEKTHGSFSRFVAALSEAELSGDIYRYVYRSPLLGVMETGWGKGLRVDGKEIATSDYPRYDNPYCKTEFNTNVFDIELGKRKLHLDFSKPERTERG